MNHRASRRPQSTLKERSDILAAYKASNLTAVNFCAQAGIKPSLLYNWLYRKNRLSKGNRSKNVSFLEVAPYVPPSASSSPAPSAPRSYKLTSASGWSLEIPKSFAPAELKTLLKLLSPA